MTDDSDLPLGAILRRLRQEKNLTGVELARLVGMSQPKISRIETGTAPAPSVGDVTKLAETLGADKETTRRLLEQAHRMQDPVEWEPTVADLELRQRETEEVELRAVDFKVFQPTSVIGLLQTGGYAEAMMTAFNNIAVPRGHPGAIFGAVSARLRRQRILSDPTKHFDFVMSEAALSNRLCPPEEMPAQIRRIRAVAKQPNVTVSIIPSYVRWRVPPTMGFSLLDDRHLFVDLFDTGITKHDELEAALYANVFSAMKEQASRNIGPILDRHLKQYIREITAE